MHRGRQVRYRKDARSIGRIADKLTARSSRDARLLFSFKGVSALLTECRVIRILLSALYTKHRVGLLPAIIQDSSGKQKKRPETSGR
jgi:hypothetical protein